MAVEQNVVFIHGLGDGPESWAPQVAALPPEFRPIPVRVPGLEPGTPVFADFSIAEAAEHIIDTLDGLEVARAHLCGLSLGAMIALRIAAAYPHRVASLTLAAGQVKPPRILMTVQNAVLRILPERFVAAGGTTKRQVLAIARGVARTDLSPHLEHVAAETLVVCGSRDRANLPAARRFAAGIPRSELHIIEGAGHRSNIDRPEQFSALLNGFITRRS